MPFAVMNLSMTIDSKTASAFISALRLACERGGASAALSDSGAELPKPERFAGLGEDFERLLGGSATDAPVRESLALGYLAGQVAGRPRVRTLQDPTSFLMDRELVVQRAEGESILRLPWFEDDLFVGRQLPDISEMPSPVRTLATERYRIALTGERNRFAFWSHGHAYSVDALPVHNDRGRVDGVLAVAVPTRSSVSVAVALDKMAERFERTAEDAPDDEASQKARLAAERARATAHALRSREEAGGSNEPPALTPREAEVLSLASHGLTFNEIAQVLFVTRATVRTHLENTYLKLGVNDKAGAVAAALRHGLID